MQLSRVPSVKDTFFQHKLLTRIQHRPSYESLQNCLNELKANASSVPTTLGGGLHGHLGLVLSDAIYGTLTNNVLFQTPQNPGPFAPPAGATGAQIDAAKDVWKDLCNTFQICQATEQALIAQVVEIIDPVYLRAMLNTTTGRYAANIRVLIDHLFTTYGKITPQQIMQKEMELQSLHFDLSHPVDIVFNAIEDLSELADHAGQPMSAMQMNALAFVIFAKQPLLTQDLRSWNRLPLAQRTWMQMKVHFRDAQDGLDSLPTASALYHQQGPFPQANVATIADMVALRLLENQSHIDRAYEMYNQQAPAPLVPPPAAPPVTDPITDMANSLQRRESDLQAGTAAMMAQMQQMMQQMITNNAGNGGRGNRNNGNNNSNGRGRGRGNRNNTRNTPRKYCWSHGSCAHLGTECNTKAAGHQNDATFANMMGGSTNGCYGSNT